MTPQQQYERYLYEQQNLGGPEDQLRRRLRFLRELNDGRTQAIRAQLAMQARQKKPAS